MLAGSSSDEETTMTQPNTRRTNKGFTLLETMIALLVLVVGILGLAAMLANALTRMQGSQNDFIAEQKAEEAMEAIFTAKYTNNISFAAVANQSVANPTGLFVSIAQPLLLPGPDGLFNSVNDPGTPPDYILLPGPDMLLGTADDIQVPLANFTRTVTITNVGAAGDLRQVVITVNYRTGDLPQSYTLTSFISAY
jgi:type II secretory pathway pseudopilin PulG